MTTAAVRALSIRQPWAGLILTGAKGVENRTWSTTWRGPLVIHAGARPDTHAPPPVRRIAQRLPLTAHTGYLGLVRLVDVHPDEGCCRPWGEPGSHHWVVADPHPFTQPVAGPGRLGLYRALPEAVLELAISINDKETAR